MSKSGGQYDDNKNKNPRLDFCFYQTIFVIADF